MILFLSFMKSNTELIYSPSPLGGEGWGEG